MLLISTRHILFERIPRCTIADGISHLLVIKALTEYLGIEHDHIREIETREGLIEVQETSISVFVDCMQSLRHSGTVEYFFKHTSRFTRTRADHAGFASKCAKKRANLRQQSFA